MRKIYLIHSVLTEDKTLDCDTEVHTDRESARHIKKKKLEHLF